MNLQDFWRFLFYGEPGSGKSDLAVSAVDDPRLRPVLYVDAEGRTKGIQQPIRNITIEELMTPVEDVLNRYEIPDWKAFEELWLKGIANLPRNAFPFKTVLFDSASTLDIYSVRFAADMNYKLADKDTPELQEYKKNFHMFSKFLDPNIKYLPAHVIMTAIPKPYEDLESAKLIVPELTGRLCRLIMASMDVTGFIRPGKTLSPRGNGKKIREVLFEAEGKIVAKDQSNRLGLKMEDPSMKKIFDLIYANQSE